MGSIVFHLNSFGPTYLTESSKPSLIDGAQSEFCNVICGIPQGSILGPDLLFTI